MLLVNSTAKKCLVFLVIFFAILISVFNMPRAEAASINITCTWTGIDLVNSRSWTATLNWGADCVNPNDPGTPLFPNNATTGPTACNGGSSGICFWADISGTVTPLNQPEITSQITLSGLNIGKTNTLTASTFTLDITGSGKLTIENAGPITPPGFVMGGISVGGGTNTTSTLNISGAGPCLTTNATTGFNATASGGTVATISGNCTWNHDGSGAIANQKTMSGTWSLNTAGSFTNTGTLNMTGGTFKTTAAGLVVNCGTVRASDKMFLFTAGAASGTTTLSGDCLFGSAVTVNASNTLVTGPGTHESTQTSGTIITNNGTFTATSGNTWLVTSAGNVTIAPVTYHNLELKPASTRTYTLAAGTVGVNGNLTIGNGTNALTANVTTNDPTLSVAGNVTIAANSTLSASNSASFTVGGNWSSSGAFTHNGGTVTMNATSTGKIILIGGLGSLNKFNNLTFNGSGGGWTLMADPIVESVLNIVAGNLDASSRIVTLSGSGTPFVISGSGTFTPSTSTVRYASASATNITATTYYNLEDVATGTVTHTLGTASGQTITVNGNLTIGNGTNAVTTTANTWNPTIAVTGNVTISSNAGSFVAPQSSSFTVGGNWTNMKTNSFSPNNGTVTFNSTTTGKTITSGSVGGGNGFYHLTFNGPGGGWTLQDNLTVLRILTISAGTLNASSHTVQLTGSGTPFVITSGTFTPSTSTVTYASGSAANITATTYYNLNVKPSGSSSIHTLGTAAGQTLIVENNLDLGSSSVSGAIITAATHNPAISVTGNLTLCVSPCPQITFIKGSGTITLKPIGTKTWTDNNPTKQDLGIVSISSGASTPKINLGSAVNAESVNIAASHTLDMNGSNTMTLTGNGTPFVIAGTFTPSTSTVTYTPTATTGVTVASTTYNHVIFNKASNTFSLTTGGITTQQNGDLTITTGILDTVSGQNYPISVGGSWSNSDTFIARNGTVTFTSTSTGKTLAGILSGSSGFYNLTFNGSGGGWSNSSAMLINNDLTMTNGTLSGTNNVNVNGSAIGTSGIINLTGGTFTQQATGGNKLFGGTAAGNNWVFNNLTFANDGSFRTVTTNSGTGTITISSVFTITSQLDARNRTWILSGSGTPLIISGILSANESTFRFTGSSATNIMAALYHNLQIFPGGTSATHTLGTASGQTFTITNNLDLGGNSNSTGTVITAATHNPAISVAGNLTLCAATCSNQMTFTKGAGTLTLKPTGTKTWTDNNPTTKQDVGIVSISSGTTTPRINLGSSVAAEVLSLDVSHTLSLNGSNTLILTGSGTPIGISGTFIPSTGTVSYENNTSANAASITYYNLRFRPSGGTPTYTLLPGTLTVTNNLDITNNGSGTPTVTANTNNPAISLTNNFTLTIGTFVAPPSASFTVGGSWSNSGTFTANSGTVIMNATTTGKTLSGTMTGSSTFNNLTFNGSGGGWTLSNDITVSSVLNIALGTFSGSSRTITLTGNGTPFVVAGTFSTATSTVIYAPTATSGVNVASTAYNHVVFNKAGNTFSLTGGITTQSNGGNLTITAGTLDTVSGENHPISVSGNWSNSGTFTPNAGTVTFTAAVTGRTIDPGSSSFNDVKFNGAGGWSFTAPLTLNGNMIVQQGTLSGTNGATINGGNLTCSTSCGAISFTGGTVTLNGTGDFGTSGIHPSWTFANLAFGDGSTTATTTSQSSGNAIVTTLTINANHTLISGNRNYLIDGSGTPFVVSGVFIPETSLVRYRSTSPTNITATDYYDLQLYPAGTVTYTLGTDLSQMIAINRNLTIGNGTNILTANVTTNDPTLSVAGNVTIAASSILSASNSASFTVGGNWINSGTFTHNSGTVTFNGTGTKTIERGASEFYNLAFSGAGTWSFTGTGSTSLSLRSFNITNTGATVTGVSGTTTMVGDWGNVGTYNHNNGTVLFTTAAVTSNVTGATTFKNLTITEETKTLKFEPGKRTKIAGVMTVGGASPTYVCAFPVNLWSTVDGSKWEIEILGGGSANIQYAYVKDSNAITTAITANNTFKSGVNSNWLGTGCLPKITTVLPSPLQGIVGSAVTFEAGYDFDANSTAIVQWGAKDVSATSLNDTTTTIKTDNRGKFQQDVAGYNKLNFFIPEDEAGLHRIAVRVGGASPRTIDAVTAALDFTLKPWFWMSDFSTRVGDTITLWGNGYVCGGLATVVRDGVDTSSTTNISLQPPPADPCTGGGGGGAEGATVNTWEEVSDF